MTIPVIILNIFLLLNFTLLSQVSVSYLPELPSVNKNIDQIGLAGGLVGISNNTLLFAGGANFPDKLPWEGGKKKWWDDIYILEQKDGAFKWNDQTFKLDNELAYGLSITTSEGVVCIGGCNQEKCFNDVFLLKWENRKIVRHNLPPLPNPLANMCGAVIDNTIYIAGGPKVSSQT